MERELARSVHYNPDTDTLDIWLGDPRSEVEAEPLTDNLVSKLNAHDTVTGYEIIELSKLNSKDVNYPWLKPMGFPLSRINGGTASS